MEPGKTVYEVLYKGLERIFDHKEFREKKAKVNEQAFTKIITETLQNKIEWERDLNEDDTFIGEAVVENASGEKVLIPVLFYTKIECGGLYGGYLHLGDKKGPCKNTADERVKSIAEQYFDKIEKLSGA
jgi:hypothetical protein